MDVLTIRSFSSVKATFGAGGLDDEACGWAMVDRATSLIGPLRRYREPYEGGCNGVKVERTNVIENKLVRVEF